MEAKRLKRLVGLRRNVRDAEVARLRDREQALEQAEQALARARGLREAAEAAFAEAVSVAIHEIELRAQAVKEASARERAATTARDQRRAECEAQRAVRLEAERELKLLGLAYEKALVVEAREEDKRELRALEERVLSTWRGE